MSDAAPLVTIELPGPITGKGRPRFDGRNGRAYTPQKTVSAESRLAYAMAQRWTCSPLDEAVALKVEIKVQVPRSKSKKWQASALVGDVLPLTKPDLDNTLKLILDAGNKILWCDDSRIVQVEIRRRYSEQPGLLIEVTRA